ncbi:7338_t:CDS:2, partial [Cetraspora pellucida]
LYSLTDNIHQTEDLTLNDLINVLKDLFSRNDQVIEQLIETFKLVNLTYDNSEKDGSIEILLISINAAITSLETVCIFLLQQDKEVDKYVKSIRK